MALLPLSETQRSPAASKAILLAIINGSKLVPLFRRITFGFVGFPLLSKATSARLISMTGGDPVFVPPIPAHKLGCRSKAIDKVVKNSLLPNATEGRGVPLCWRDLP